MSTNLVMVFATLFPLLAILAILSSALFMLWIDLLVSLFLIILVAMEEEFFDFIAMFFAPKWMIKLLIVQP